MKGLSLVNAGSLLRGTIDAPTMLIQPAPTEKRNTALPKPHNAASTFKRVSQSVPFAHFAGKLRNASTVMLSINVLTTSVDSSSNAWRSEKSSSKTPALGKGKGKGRKKRSEIRGREEGRKGASKEGGNEGDWPDLFCPNAPASRVRNVRFALCKPAEYLMQAEAVAERCIRQQQTHVAHRHVERQFDINLCVLKRSSVLSQAVCLMVDRRKHRGKHKGCADGRRWWATQRQCS